MDGRGDFPRSSSHRVRSFNQRKKEPTTTSKQAYPAPQFLNINCHSSPGHVAAVMSKFDSRKRDLVKSIGFGGLLEIHDIGDVNMKFSIWLLSHTNWESAMLEIGQNRSVKFAPDDIERIIGTPSSGKDVIHSSIKEEEKPLFIAQHLSFLGVGDEQSLLERALLFVQQDLPIGFSHKLANQFKVAFVIFIMGRFLAPTNDLCIGNWDFWSALEKPDDIKHYNWSAYILNCLLDSARVIMFSGLLNKSVSKITGCPLLLQIFYLDNTELGEVLLPHDTFPRVKAFNCNLLDKLIQALPISLDVNSAPASEARNLAESCYDMPDHIFSPNDTNKSSPNSRLRAGPRKRGCLASSPRSNNTPGCSKLPINSNIARSLALDFPGYIRTNYPEHVDNSFIEALRYHNARCLQHINNSKNALIATIVGENMALADKFIQHNARHTASGIPKYPRTIATAERKTYDDLLSGPDSGSEVSVPCIR